MSGPFSVSLVTMRATERAHEAVRAIVRAGDHVIDATAGNGWDTCFLADLVGPEGRVFAFDIQEEAIASTKSRLVAQGIKDERVTLIHESHAALQRHIEEPVAAVMFNLGYRPGGDHELRTHREETLTALAEGWTVLREGGVMSVVCYRGHPGGMEEGEGVLEFAGRLQGRGAVVGISGKKETEAGPFLVVLKKRQPEAFSEPSW